MNPTRLRKWVKRHGRIGVFVVAVYLALHSLWVHRVKIAGVCVAFALGVLCATISFRERTGLRKDYPASTSALSSLSPHAEVPPKHSQTSRATRERDAKVTWQLAESPVIRLMVRDKHGTLGSYDAVFIVTGPNKEKTQKRIHVEYASPGEVTFPNDFPDYIGYKGKFLWECWVEGKVVVNGAFSYHWKGPSEYLLVPRGQ